jgi:pSer/pThr/pTyr-binding forkhead associated (FHA) protein
MPVNDDETIEDEPTAAVRLTKVINVSPELRPAILVLVHGPDAPKEYPILKDEVVIGRSDTADVQVPGHSLSRKHVIIRREGCEFRCFDNNSQNGVLLNGVRIHTAALRDGDNIQLGEVVFVFHEGRL